MRKPFVIRDPVHGYLRVAAHERIVVDHPVTQRLRRITQTGLAELVFPEARTSRFVHSLGAMHIASRFVIAGLEHASVAHANAFFTELKEHVDLAISPSREQVMQLSELNSERGTGGLLSGSQTFTNAAIRNDEDHIALLVLAEAATRLAALFHDLGHMPYSHDFEYALKAFAKQSGTAVCDGLAKLTSGTPHEILGHQLADLVFQGLANECGSDASRAAFKLAKEILDVEADYEMDKPQVSALGWLHSLVDGQVDVDRADYLLRDARALGFEFAGYNLDQIIDNLLLVRDEDLGFVTAIDEKGLVGLESFCISRSRSNQVLVRHHKSAQIGAAFRLASVEALSSKHAGSFLIELGKILSVSSDGANARALLEAFSRHDDPWWLEALRDDAAEPKDALSQAARELVLQRGDKLRSVWKRKGDLTVKELKAVNRLAASFAENLEAFARASHLLRERDGVVIAIHKFAPFTKTAKGESVLLVKTSRGLRPASEISSLIAALDQAWENDLHMHAFCLRDNKVTPAAVLAALQEGLAGAENVRARGGKRQPAKKRASKSVLETRKPARKVLVKAKGKRT